MKPLSPNVPAFLSARLKIHNALSRWNFITNNITKTIQNTRINYEMRPHPGNPALQFVTAIPTPMPDPWFMSFIPDTIHGLSSSLDHMVYELFQNYGGKESDARMPFGDDRSHIEDYLNKQGKRLPPEIRDWILTSVAPHKNGGNLDLCALRKLDNIDKHRQINLGVAAIVVENVETIGSNVVIQGLDHVVNLFQPTPLEPFGAISDAKLPEEVKLSGVELGFREEGIFGPDDEPMADFIYRVGSKLADLTDELAQLTYGANEGNRPSFRGHSGWTRYELPKPPPPQLPTEMRVEAALAQLRGNRKLRRERLALAQKRHLDR